MEEFLKAAEREDIKSVSVFFRSGFFGTNPLTCRSLTVQ